MSFPRRRETSFVPSWIPACAGMTKIVFRGRKESADAVAIRIHGVVRGNGLPQPIDAAVESFFVARSRAATGHANPRAWHGPAVLPK